MTISPRQALEDGAKILEPFLNQKGFTFFVVDEGKGSGGPFATGEFRNGNRRLEIHKFRRGTLRDPLLVGGGTRLLLSVVKSHHESKC